ncbi:MAG TPA: isoprenylcysteine carboxylmethyltransferase family protein [Rhizomicrobium sp.]|jgi:protein-S-isoprenylcysteine O-methyltransferase|nr:isoprenylcysteine carboxylmethyltransferase family protein [Rhizomicrobium sp.]
MSDALRRLADLWGLALPPHVTAALLLIVLFELQAYVRFGATARRVRGGASDGGSTRVLMLAYLVVIFGFLLTIRTPTMSRIIAVPNWFVWPGPTPVMVRVAWAGVALGLGGLCLRLWAVLTLRHRYTRTLLIDDDGHTLERRGPYRVVRHPGYLGSVLCFTGFALASASLFVVALSVAATLAAYAYRIAAEDRMLMAQFGAAYAQYRREVAALLPFVW